MRGRDDVSARVRPRARDFRLIRYSLPLNAPAIAVLGLGRRLGRAAAYFMLCGFTLSPLFFVSIPPLVDYPNHLARMSILLRPGGDDAALAANYQTHWRLLPNLAMDLIVPPLAHLVSLEWAGWIFVAATMILLVVATSTLHRVLHGRSALWPLCSLLFLYNAVLWWGFLNYLFTLSIALLGFSGWVATGNWPRVVRIGAFAIFASLLFVFHLFALGVYGLLVAAFEIGNRFPLRRLGDGKAFMNAASAVAYALAQFAPAAALWLASLANGGRGFTAMGDLDAHLYGLLAPAVFDNPPAIFDRVLLVFSLFFLYVAWRKRALWLAPEMRVPIAAMLIASAFMPEWVSGSWAAQIRLPVAATFVLIASLRPRFPRDRFFLVFAGAAAVLLAMRVWLVTESWQATSDRFSEFRSAAQVIPRGARIVTVQSAMPKDWGGARHSWLLPTSPVVYDHMPALAVIDRAAFIPSLFAGWCPIEVAPRNRGLASMLRGALTPAQLAARASRDAAPSESAEGDVLGEAACCFNWPETYDVVLWIDFGHPPDVLPPHLEPLGSGSFFHIYRIAGR